MTIFLRPVACLAAITARVVTSPPFLAKKAQSAQFTVFISSSAHSIITGDTTVVQLLFFS